MTKKYLSESIKLGTKELIVETGKVAKQADGSVVIRYMSGVPFLQRCNQLPLSVLTIPQFNRS